MNEQEMLLLHTINSALQLKPTVSTLLAEEVNGLGAALGLNPQEILHFIEDLNEAGFVELRWPGKVSVSSKGRSVLNQVKPTGDQITLGPGAVYIKDSQIGAGSAVGSNAMAAGAVRIDQGPLTVDLSRAIADLVAAHQHLAREQTALAPPAQEPVQHLAEETDAIQREMRKPVPNKVLVEQRLDRAKTYLEKLGGITAAAASLKPALEFLHRSFGWITNYLRSIAS